MKLAVDIGGSYLRYEVLESKIFQRVSISGINIINFLEHIINKYNIKKIAVSFAGQVFDGKIIGSPNIPLKNFDFCGYFKRLGIECILENDLNCAALAEANFFKSSNIVSVYSGTGLGCGAVLGGKLLSGYRGFACEIGHIAYKRAPFKCGCGKDNCVELFASGSGIKKWAEYLGLKDYDIAHLYSQKNQIAEDYFDALSFAVGTVITLLNPEVVVLGGGIIRGNSFIVDEVKNRITKYTLKPALNYVKIEKSQLENGSLEGAKLLLR